MKSNKKSSLKDRLKTNYNNKDKGGGGQSCFEWKKIKGDVKFYQPKEKKNYIDIIPYKIKTKNHPLVKTGDANIGDLDYLIDVWTHNYIGPSKSMVICPKRNFNKPCPICEQADKFREEGKDKEKDELRAKRVVWYNVRDSKNPDKGVMIFQVTHSVFEKELLEAARDESDSGDLVDFVDPEDGKTICFKASPATWQGRSYFEYKNFSFVEREEPIDDDLLEKAISFDEIMKINSYEEIKKLLYGDDEDDDSNDEDDPKSKKKKSNKKDKEDDDEEDDDSDDSDDDNDDSDEEKEDNSDDDEEDDEEDDSDDKDDDDDVEDDDEDEDEKEDDDEDEKPAKKSSAKKTPTKKTEVKKASAKKTSTSTKTKDGECPKDHTFGKDCDKFEDDCDSCPVWDKCAKKQNELKKEKK